MSRLIPASGAEKCVARWLRLARRHANDDPAARNLAVRMALCALERAAEQWSRLHPERVAVRAFRRPGGRVL